MADDIGKRGIDWEAIEATPEFRELVDKRRAFVLPATIFFLAYYMAFILLAGYAPDFMGSSIYEGLTVGYVLALTQFVMVFALGMLYLRRSAKVFDPLSEAAIERYVDQEEGGRLPADGREHDGKGGPAAAPGAVKA